MGYTIYGKHLEIDTEFIKIGDTVRIIDINIIPNKETINWLDKESKNVFIGDMLTIKTIIETQNGDWVTFLELNLAHPIEQFKKVSKVK